MGLIRLLPRSGGAQPAVEPVDDITPEMPLEEEALVESPVVSEPAHEPESAEVVPVHSLDAPSLFSPRSTSARCDVCPRGSSGSMRSR